MLITAQGGAMKREYGIRTTVNASYEDAIPKVTEALKQEGFAVLIGEIELGLLLPCNVLVSEGNDGKTVVSAQNPDTMLAVIGNERLRPMAEEAKVRLERAIRAVGAALGAKG
jgi:uncharacterized protein (DUF302 family)